MQSTTSHEGIHATSHILEVHTYSTCTDSPAFHLYAMIKVDTV